MRGRSGTGQDTVRSARTWSRGPTSAYRPPRSSRRACPQWSDRSQKRNLPRFRMSFGSSACLHHAHALDVRGSGNPCDVGPHFRRTVNTAILASMRQAVAQSRECVGKCLRGDWRTCGQPERHQQVANAKAPDDGMFQGPTTAASCCKIGPISRRGRVKDNSNDCGQRSSTVCKKLDSARQASRSSAPSSSRATAGPRSAR